MSTVQDLKKSKATMTVAFGTVGKWITAEEAEEILSGGNV